jgi:V/A-type H+-transporting ATPase subunit E
MAAEKVSDKILADARERVEKIALSAKKEADQILYEASEEASRHEQEGENRIAQEAEQEKMRLIGLAQLEMRKAYLGIRRELLDMAFDQALDRLVSQEDHDYQKLLRGLLMKAVETGDEELILSSRDRQRLGESFLHQINAELSQSGRQGRLRLSDETRDIRGGFLLRKGKIETNCTLEALVTAAKDDMEVELVPILFG